MIQCSHDYFFPGHLSQSTFPDLSLTTPDGGGRFVPAHRVVLAAVSSKLAGLCQDGGTVVVRNISFNVLEKFIKFIYSGSINLDTEEDVDDLRDGLDMLKMNVAIEMIKSAAQPGLNQEVDKAHCSKVFNEKDNVDENLKVELSTSCISKLANEDMEDSEMSSALMPVNSSHTKDSGVNIHPGKKKPTSTRKAMTYKIQSREIVCEYCGSNIMYRKYVDHCKKLHPSSPWNTKRKCGTCKNVVPPVIFNFHKESEENFDSKSQKCKELGSVASEDISNNKKAQTKVSCNYCEEQVTLASYVKHCTKLHSISDSNERCRKKCFKCGAKVHIVAEKFHDMIYHPATPRLERDDSVPLKIVEHNKNLTQVPCDFCRVKVVYGAYKSHVRNKHPEVSYSELVSCSKCGSKVPKISFKYHRLIFHNSHVLKALKVPKIKVPCALCDARVKPHLMVLHMQNVHGTGGNPAGVFSEVNGGTNRGNFKEEIVLLENIVLDDEDEMQEELDV